MSAAKALISARATDISVMFDSDDLWLQACAPAPPAVLDIRSRHKARIVMLLYSSIKGWSSEDWRTYERSGIAEFYGGVTAPRSRGPAFAEGTLGCIRACWPAWHEARKTEAIAALAAMGINQPRTDR